MVLNDFINSLVGSELRSLAVAEEPEMIVSFINTGIIELYNKFPIKTEEYTIQVEGGKTIYELPEDFLYIISASEYTDTGIDSGVASMPINETNNLNSLNTVSFNQVQIPLNIEGREVYVIYVPKPRVLSHKRLHEEIPVPDVMLQALMSFVGFKGHGAIHLDGQSKNADVYYARFRQLCDELSLRSTPIAPDSLDMGDRLFTRGFP